MSKRSEARELAFKTIYSKFFNIDEENLEQVLPNNNDLTTKIVDCYTTNHKDINELISSNLKGYTLERVYKIDLAILVVAIIELQYIKENPTQVIINEAVELAKKFSTDKSPKFINGFLAGLVK